MRRPGCGDDLFAAQTVDQGRQVRHAVMRHIAQPDRLHKLGDAAVPGVLDKSVPAGSWSDAETGFVHDATLPRRVGVHPSCLRVLLRAHHFDADEGLVPHDPGVVSGRDRVGVASGNRLLSPILQAHDDGPGHSVADMRRLA